jgi:hypothetical protein
LPSIDQSFKRTYAEINTTRGEAVRRKERGRKIERRTGRRRRRNKKR